MSENHEIHECTKTRDSSTGGYSQKCTDGPGPKSAKPVSDLYQIEVRALADIALKYCYWIYTVSILVSLAGTTARDIARVLQTSFGSTGASGTFIRSSLVEAAGKAAHRSSVPNRRGASTYLA